MNGIVRIGIVTDVDAASKKARVLYPDSGLTSAWLCVLRHGEAWIPSVNSVVLCLYLPVFNGDGFIVGVIQ